MSITTSRLFLRKFHKEDIDLIASLFADRQVMEFSLKGPLSYEESKEAFEKRILTHYETFGFGPFAMFLQSNGDFVGIAGPITQIIDEKQEIELGYRLYPKYWNLGLATEACIALKKYIFQELTCSRFICLIDPNNHRSIRVAHKTGMHFWKTSLFHGKPTSVYSLSKVALSPFQNTWQTTFLQEKEHLEKAFAELDISFHHIGSTSIPGCFAKPIIDILGVTSDITLVDSYTQKLEALGYNPKGEHGMRHRRFFTKTSVRPVNLHIFEDSNPETVRHLRFCTYMKNHREKVEEYSQIKIALAKQFPHDIAQYVLGKQDWIKSIDEKAAWEKTQIKEISTNTRRKSSWSLEEILFAMHANMHLHMTYFTKYIPSSKTIFDPNVTIVQSDICDDTFNYVLFARLEKRNAMDVIRHICSLYKKKGLPFSWWLGEFDTPGNLTDLLEHEGLVFKEENIGMYCDLTRFTTKKSISSLKIYQVNNQKNLEDFCNVLISLGGNPKAFETIYSKIPPILYEQDACFTLYVGYVENEPVTTGILVLDANVAGIYYITTTPQKRKQGYASHMMNHLLQKAQSKGYTIATLQASSKGKTLYEHLGFIPCSSFKEYALPTL